VSLRDRLDADLKQAMRARDTVRLDAVRSVRGAVKNREIELGEALDEDGIVRVIRSLVKQRMESVEQYRQAGRDELADKEEGERAVLEAYLPSAPDAAQTEAAVRAAIESTGAEGPRDMGKVMKAALEALGPAADGKAVSTLAKRILAG
jgi:uncharacterized protein